MLTFIVESDLSCRQSDFMLQGSNMVHYDQCLVCLWCRCNYVPFFYLQGTLCLHSLVPVCCKTFFEPHFPFDLCTSHHKHSMGATIPILHLKNSFSGSLISFEFIAFMHPIGNVIFMERIFDLERARAEINLLFFAEFDRGYFIFVFHRF